MRNDPVKFDKSLSAFRKKFLPPSSGCNSELGNKLEAVSSPVDVLNSYRTTRRQTSGTILFVVTVVGKIFPILFP